jgi:ankyrin repeat protein
MTDLAEKVDAFLQASVRDWTGRAARLLAATPEIAGYSFATAVMLGDAGRVRQEIEHDPAAATRADERTWWTPLHAVCGSRWFLLDPARADGLLAVARVLLDAGADLEARARGGRTPLGCATATASSGTGNEPMIRLLLERGAVPDDDDLYLVGFATNAHQCLRLLLDHTPDVAGTVEKALSVPIGRCDIESCRLLLEAGADPRRYVDDSPCSAVYTAVRAACPAELVELLLAHGADLATPGPDGRSPHRLAVLQGRSDLAAVLRRHGVPDDATDADRLLSACLRGDRTAAQRFIADHPGLLDELTRDDQGAVIVQAADAGGTAAVELMLDLDFPTGARGGDFGGTALHAAAYAGSDQTVRLLLRRGADIEARDTTWNDTPLGWACVGSGQRPRSSPAPDWVATVRTLIEAGAQLDGLTLSPDDPKPPSPEVARLLRDHGVGEERSGSEGVH